MESTKIISLLLMGFLHVMDDFEVYAHCLCREVMYVEFDSGRHRHQPRIPHESATPVTVLCIDSRDHGLLERC